MDAEHLPWSAPCALPSKPPSTVNGVSLTYFEWGREHGGDPILLAHATGFHARCWDQVVAHLGRRRVIAIDQRGHGRSDKVTQIRWQEFGRDLAELVRRLDLHDVVGVGHSAGGHAMIEAAALEPARFRRLVLIDPTILAPEQLRGARLGRRRRLRRGRRQHPSRRQAPPPLHLDRRDDRAPAERPSFARFTPAALRDYCTWGLVPCVDPPGFELACSPEMEGAVYSGVFGNPAIHDARARRRGAGDWCCARWSRARRPTSPTSATRRPGRALASALRARPRRLPRPDRTHFMPMEDPKLVASVVLTATR